jgi:putative transposase
MLHLALGNKESYPNWLESVRDILGRGSQTPVLVPSDWAPGLIRAVQEMCAHSLRQRCLAHKTRNIISKIPDHAKGEVRAAVRGANYTPNRELARMIAADTLRTHQHRYASAVRSFRDDWAACMAYAHCPAIHHRRIRTTNLLERSFLEECRRTRTISTRLQRNELAQARLCHVIAS